MTFLMVTKVILGMFMDPFGAVILVSGTLAPIAYANGIDPIHFWMMVLVAFELGYLMPPVVLNQLLTRLVIGDKEVRIADDEVKRKKFYWRYERWILPTIVMTVGMIVTAYGPLAVQKFDFLKPIASLFHPAEVDSNAPTEVPDEAPASPAAPASATEQSAAEAVPPASPTPASAEASAPAVDASQAVQTSLQAWAQAWSGKHVDGYLSHYASDFVASDGTPRPAWDAQRRKRIESKHSIEVSLADVQVQMSGNVAKAQFVQQYRAGGLNEVVTKRMTLQQDPSGRWLIDSETQIKN